MRQGNDIGTQYRSVIFCDNESDKAIAQNSLEQYQNALHDSGYGNITTEIKVESGYFLAEEYRATNNYYKAVYYIDVEIDGTLGTGYTYTFTFPDNTSPDYDRAVNFYTNILDTYLYERNLDGYHHSTNITGTLPASI